MGCVGSASVNLPSCCLIPSLFFSQIKRPYFHVKPLDRAQLKAWQSYLDWEIAEAETAAVDAEGAAVEGNEGSKQECVAGHNRVLILFERCLIACALYEEFWNKVSIEGRSKQPVIKDHDGLFYNIVDIFVAFCKLFMCFSMCITWHHTGWRRCVMCTAELVKSIFRTNTASTFSGLHLRKNMVRR